MKAEDARTLADGANSNSNWNSNSNANANAHAIELRVNDRVVCYNGDPSKRLSECLRDDLLLTGTKVGCHAGDCGACTVLLDGEQYCSCLLAVGQCAARSITTVEGLADAAGQPNRLQQAFIEHGAAQCGICTPAMLMAATDLLQRHPQPTEQQVCDGLGGVLCRCTGYQKIVEAVLAAATDQVAAEPVSVRATDLAAGQAVGARLERFDALSKVTGREQYGADAAPTDALWLRVVRSPYPRADFVLGDIDRFVAEHAGLTGAVYASDIPNNRFAIFADLRDQPALASGHVRMRGEAVLAIVGSQQAIELLEPKSLPIQWHPLNALTEPEQSLAAAATDAAPIHDRWPDNVLCRGRVVKGDVDTAIANAATRLSAQMSTSYVEHAYIEPEAGYAQWQPAHDGVAERVTVFATTQTPYMDRDELAFMFNLQPTQVQIVPSAVGGGFGGKLDLSIQPLLVAAARKFGKPVRIVYSRPESMVATTKRHPATMSATLAADAQGNLLAYDFKGDFNTGAYSSWGPTVANRVPIHASGPYRVASVRALTQAVLTNNANSGAFRGFGVPQSTLINEQLIDQLALQRGQDPLEFRLRHALRAGDTTPTGQLLGASVGLRECLLALRPAWQQMRAASATFNSVNKPFNSVNKRRGVGVACMWYGIGNTVIANPSTMTIALRSNGRFMLYNGAIDIGQGTYTIMAQIAADALGVAVALIDQSTADTDVTEDAGKSSASRQTFVSGNAARLAALDLRAQLLKALAMSDAPADTLLTIVDGEQGRLLHAQNALGSRQMPLASLRQTYQQIPQRAAQVHDDDLLIGKGYFNPPTVPLDVDGQGVPYASYGFAAQFAQVEVDIGLGTVKVLSIHAAHDIGRAVNPTQVEGQIHGGIAQGLGMALMEEYKSGQTDNLHDYLIPTVGDMPPIVVHLIEDLEPIGPYGAKGVGEPALVATAPAILNAIFDATGVRVHHVPATPDRLLAAISAAKTEALKTAQTATMNAANGVHDEQR